MGHQDRHNAFDDLDLPSQLNCEANALATNEPSLSTLPPYPFFTSTATPLHVTLTQPSTNTFFFPPYGHTTLPAFNGLMPHGTRSTGTPSLPSTPKLIDIANSFTNLAGRNANRGSTTAAPSVTNPMRPTTIFTNASTLLDPNLALTSPPLLPINYIDSWIQNSWT
jgi:hypothetical protein